MLRTLPNARPNTMSDNPLALYKPKDTHNTVIQN